MIVVFGGEKGGTGKTTLATNLAVMRAREGRDVLLLDTDVKQGTASEWAGVRDGEGHGPRVSCVAKGGPRVDREIGALKPKFDDIVVDTGGRDSPEWRSALLSCDAVYIPVRPSQADMWTLDKVSQIILEAGAYNPGLSAWVVFNLAHPNPAVKEVEDARGYLAGLGGLSVSGAILRDRITYRYAMRDGLGVVEAKPADKKAVEEIKMLYKEIWGHGESRKQKTA